MSFKLLALDLDGTVLDGRGALRSSVVEAVQRVRCAGVEVVVCTGRRFRRALPHLRALGLEGSVVVHNGVVVKDIASGSTLHHDYLPGELCSPLGRIMAEMGPPLVYVDAFHREIDIVTQSHDRAHPFQRDYLGDNLEFVHWVESAAEIRDFEVIMMSAMGDAEHLGRLSRRLSEELGASVRTNYLMNKVYQGYILEVVSASSGKWPALRRLAAERGITAEEIVAVGDDTNDAEMIEKAGAGVAMGNAARAVLDAADWVAPDNDRDGVVAALGRYFPA